MAGGAASQALAQYPGRVVKTTKPDSVLRSIAVLEWTGEAGKPSASRLVPVAVFDGEQLNDGTIYLNRPEPLALQNGVEYELQQAGKPMGLFDVFAAGESQGAWRGFGAWKPYSEAKIKSDQAFNQSSLYAQVDIKDDDKPVLKRKHPKGTDGDDPKPKADAKPSTGTSADSGATKTSSTADDDPDRPKLKRKASSSGDSASTSSSDSSNSGSSGSASSSTTTSTPAADADPDRPVLKRKSSSSDSGTTTASGSGAGTGAADPDRPTIRRTRKNLADAGMMETSTSSPDPDRPRLMRGKPTNLGVTEAPRLMGSPPAMEQVVAVSDASNRAEHPWKYSWANPDDELKMKSALEDMARTAMGLDAAAAPAAAAGKPAPKATVPKTAVPKTGARRTAVKKKAAPAVVAAPVQVALEDEKFHVFELTYGSSATMVLTASAPITTTLGADGVMKAAPQKFVTLIAQPDLYGGVLVVFKSVTDSAHLDETPRMRLVDAVDAEGDNRGELLFELRGASQRQFALYRVLRGSAEQLFATVSIP